MIYEKETGILRGCFFDVQNEVGLGRREEAYHRACILWFKAEGIPFQSRPPHHLLLGTRIAHTLIPDLVLWDRITVELKVLRRELGHSDLVQPFDYLKRRRDSLGLVVNFGLDRVYVKRLAYTAPACRLKEDWRHWAIPMCGKIPTTAIQAREALRRIYRSHSTGYGEALTRSLILAALDEAGLSYSARPTATALFRGHKVDESQLDCILIEDCIVLVFTALLDSNQFAISLGLSYARTLGLRYGIAANYGRTEAQLTGLCQRD